MLDLLYSTTMLAFESNEVINLRVAKICLGGEGGRAESILMVNEKLSACIEMIFGMMDGTTPHAAVARYRDHVAANQLRLSTP